MALKLIGYDAPLNARLNKTQIAAVYAGVQLERMHCEKIQDWEAFQNNCSPQGSHPVLQTEQGYIFESGAILRYVGRLGKDSGIYGSNDFEAASIDSWIDYVTTELDTNTFRLLGVTMGYVQMTEEEMKAIVEGVKGGLAGLERWLEIRTFLVGDRISIADFAVFATIDSVLRGTAAAGEVSKFKNVYRHYLTVLHQPKVQEALKLAGHEGLIPAKPKEEKPAAAAKPAKAEKKEEKPAALEFDEEPVEEKKKPNPLDALPPSKFVLDAFKREYSNTDTRKVAAPYFFDNFDKDGFTCFWCNYKYNEDNKMQFMTANLVRGWFQRMDHCRKYAFGCALLVGEDSKHDLTAFWVFRGKGMPQIISDVDDSELFEWTEIADVNAEREKITDYLCWDGKTFTEKPVLEGRCFK